MNAWDRVQKQVSLKRMNSWLVGGEAEYLAEPESLEELRDIYLEAQKRELVISVLGGGTNVLIPEEGVEGLVISTRFLNKLEFKVEIGRANRQELHIFAQAGVPKSELLKIFLREKQAPALFLAGLPGNVGGGIAMNAGVSEHLVPREFQEITDSITVLKPSGEFVDYVTTDLEWGYRKCRGWQPGIVVSAHLSWPVDFDPQINEQVRELNKQRLLKQPLEFPSCGSVFRNPEGHSAGKLIDESGLKGYTLGGAQVSTKHANFIINTGTATATDIWHLIQIVQRTVLEKKGIELVPEVVWLGRH